MLWIMGEGYPVLGLQHSGGVLRCTGVALRLFKASFLFNVYLMKGRRFLGKSDGNAYM